MKKISTLVRSDGSTCDDELAVNSEVQGFYNNLYTSQGNPIMEDVLNMVPEKLDGSARDSLQEEYTEEFRVALFQMHPSKAPGADGFTAGFFSDIGI